MPDEHYFPAIRQLAEYEVWCNRRALEVAGALSREQLFQPFPFGFQTIHATLFHIVEVINTWGGCVAPAITKPAIIPYDPVMSLDQIAAWNEELSIALLNSIDASHAAGLLHQDRRLHQVFHLVTHGTHHRTQFITMLRLLGIDPPFEAGDFGGWSNAR
jgi:uncharacterized damage-inducible protein DinB